MMVAYAALTTPLPSSRRKGRRIRNDQVRICFFPALSPSEAEDGKYGSGAPFDGWLSPGLAHENRPVLLGPKTGNSNKTV